MSPCCHSLCGSVDWNILIILLGHILRVTPFVGVWIEIAKIVQLYNEHLVTPFVGVWIEIPRFYPSRPGTPSHSLCGSVDWNKAQRRFWSVEHVTPFVGVWIEMREKAIQYLRTKSLPLWECGLKSELDAYRLSAYASLPLWECGLKLSSWITMQSPDLVTPLVRVWIEIAWNDSDCIRCEKSLPL